MKKTMLFNDLDYFDTTNRFAIDDYDEHQRDYEFEQMCENIDDGLKKYATSQYSTPFFITRNPTTHLSSTSFEINGFDSFKEQLQEFYKHHEHSVINETAVGVDENGTLFVKIHSGNATYSQRYEIKCLTPLGQEIWESFENSDDSRDEENYGAFDSLHKAFNGEFGAEDLCKILWNNPKYSQQVEVSGVDYDKNTFQKNQSSKVIESEVDYDLYKKAVNLFPTKTLDFYSDPAHGWLKVPFGELYDLEIARYMSCSFERGEFAYLEEDCAMPVYIAALNAQGYNVKFNFHESDRSSKIRGYDMLPNGSMSEFYTHSIQKSRQICADKINKLIESGLFIVDEKREISLTKGITQKDLKNFFSSNNPTVGLFCLETLKNLDKQEKQNETLSKVRKI